MSDQATFGIAIVGDNRTEKGARAAEKRLGAIPKRVGTLARREEDRDDRRFRSRSRSMLRTFGEVEQASARAFGGRGITSGLTTRLGAARQAAVALEGGLGGAVEAGGLLSTTMGVVGAATAATVGVMAAAAYGAFKLADGWAKGAASIGRTAEIIGVGTKAMQEYEAASQRAGLKEGEGTAALGGLSQTLNDARYGRNGNALALLGKLGVGLKTKQDGTVDVEGMLPALSDALARQNSAGFRTVASMLGMTPEAALVMKQGGKALSAEMADAGQTAPIVSDEDVKVGKRMQRRHVIAGQVVQREVVQRAGRYAAGGLDTAETWAVHQFGGSVSRQFVPAAEKMNRAADKFVGAVNYAGGGGGRLSRQGAISEARKGVRLRDKLVASGFSKADADALAANAVRESGADYRRREKGGGGVGLWQWTNKKRKDDFQRIMGVPVERSSEDQQIQFLKWELSHKDSEASGWRRAHANGSDAGSVAAGFTAHVERPKMVERDSAERAAVARALESIPVNVTVKFENAPGGTRAKATAGSGRAPAVSHAYEPARGG